MRQYFETGITKPFSFRKDQLGKLKRAIIENEQAIQTALYKDLKKSPEETWVTETGMLLSEISYTLDHLQEWMDVDKVNTNFLFSSTISRVGALGPCIRLKLFLNKA